MASEEPVIQYLISRVVYNRSFHPLATYNGPLLWSASQISFIRSMLAGDLRHDVNSTHEHYGEIVRIGLDELSYRPNCLKGYLYKRILASIYAQR